MKPESWIEKINGNEFKVMRLNDAPLDDIILDCVDVVHTYLRTKLAESVIYRPDVENLIVICLNSRANPIGFEIVSTGTLTGCFCEPREVFKAAIVANAASIILAHNHPSGDCTPSRADEMVTHEMIKAGMLMKIPVLDHFILGRGNPPELAKKREFCSMKEGSYFYI